ncbi:sensor histidine kinase [Plantactinospora sp. KLBMP9567]|uniref:sensor histidine kinase n=1 Tax=Plantactinospora sp. KLBMP9567 TaxID=3085900 RepID=UPI002980BD69|nr:sensor domain-containing protein [Plantactinospora sp. KLBMP9567]MDW5326683.1 sensor domain-containing protein [Plantactinospora sp. KLBMP9567]
MMWWRRAVWDAGHLLVSTVLGLAALGLLPLTAVALVLCLLPPVGAPVLRLVTGLIRRLADRQRRRVGAPIPSPYPAAPGGIRDIVTDPAFGRDLGWLLGHAVTGTMAMFVVGQWLAGLQGLVIPVLYQLLPADVELQYQGLPITSTTRSLLTVPMGVLILFGAYFLPRAYRAGEAGLARWLLSPTAAARLSARVERLVETRTAVVDASATELRRIERDLHDGAQARLVALTMNLGMAEDMFDADPVAAKAMLADARAGAQTAMSELRDLVRGIHPPMLADRGLAGAAESLAAASPVPVALDLRLGQRLGAPVESAAYFVLAEALANAIRHAGATRIEMSVVDEEAQLRLRVHDDGRGGADPALGTGLRGIERRLGAFDGSVTVTSPLGGPTLVEAVLPCGS